MDVTIKELDEFMGRLVKQWMNDSVWGKAIKQSNEKGAITSMHAVPSAQNILIITKIMDLDRKINEVLLLLKDMQGRQTPKKLSAVH